MAIKKCMGIFLLLLSLAVPASADDTVVRFAVIGDMGIGCAGGGGAQCRIADWMCAYRESFDFVIMLGDNIYESGNPADFPAKFEVPYRCLLEQGVPFYPALGNHDTANNLWVFESFHVNYPNYQMMDDRDLVRRRYYSYRKGAVTRNDQVIPLVEFLALDSNRFSYPIAPPDPDQIPWLQRRLRESDAIWKIPYLHHPLYSSARTHGSSRTMQQRFEQIFLDAGIKVVFAGHDHTFEETRPQNGIIHFVSGSAGKIRVRDINRSSPLYEKFNDYKQHFMLVEVTEQYLSWIVIDLDGNPYCYVRGDDVNPIDCWGWIER